MTATMLYGLLDRARDPRWPDPYVFGAPGAAQRRYAKTMGATAATCPACGVQWRDGTLRACWCCGKP